MALTGRRPAEIFFSASFSLPREKVPFPSPPLRRPTGKPAKLPAPAPSPTSSLSPATLKKLVQASRLSVRYESFPSPKAVNTTTGPQLPKYVSAAFGSLDLPWFINLSCICFAAGAAFLFLALRPSFAQKANPSSQSLATKVDENILTRSMLTDDWAGARSLLGGYGVRFGPEFTQFYQGLFAGIGPSSFEYAGRFDGFIDVDLSKLADTRWLPEILRA